MFRFLFQFVALLILFAIARKVMTWVLGMLASSFRASSQQQQPEPPKGNQPITSAGELYRDPVCGTFVPATSNWTRTVNGHKEYFCSANCRDEAQVSARR